MNESNRQLAKSARKRLKKAYGRDHRPFHRATASKAHAHQLEIIQAKERIISGIHMRHRQKCFKFLSDPSTISVEVKLARDTNQLSNHVTLDVHDKSTHSLSKTMKILTHQKVPAMWTISTGRIIAGGDPDQQPPKILRPATAGTSSHCSGATDADDLASIVQMSKDSYRQELVDRLKHARNSKPKPDSANAPETAPRRIKPIRKDLSKVTYRSRSASASRSGTHLERDLGPYAAAGMRKALEKAAQRHRDPPRSPSLQTKYYEDQQCEYEEAVAPLKRNISILEHTIDDLPDQSVCCRVDSPKCAQPTSLLISLGKGNAG